MRARTIAGVAAVLISSYAYGDTLALWTFETSVPTTAGPHSAETGSGQATGFHTGASTYSNPVGNGSAESFSSNTWATNDYYQFTTSSTGYENIIVSFDQTRSGTGPASFDFRYSTDGTNFTSGGTYTVAEVSWSSGTESVLTTDDFSFDLSSISALDNAATIYFRLQSTVTVAAGGTSRVDNVLISGAPIVQVVPLPLAFLGGGSLLALMAMRRSPAGVA